MGLKGLAHLCARRSCMFSRTVPAQSVMASATLQQCNQITVPSSNVLKKKGCATEHRSIALECWAEQPVLQQL